MKNGLLLCILLLPTFGAYEGWAASVRCPVRGIDAINAAQEKGYATKATKQKGAGSCIISGNTGVAAAIADGDGLTCRFEFFTSSGNQSFTAGWKRAEVEFRNKHSRVPGSKAENPYLAIDVSATPGETTTSSMGTLTLEGPNCATWREAFPPQ